MKGDTPSWLLTETVAGRWVVEASDIKGAGARFDPAQGLIVQGPTGARHPYTIAHVEVDQREGEVLWWRCKPSSSGSKLPDIVVFND